MSRHGIEEFMELDEMHTLHIPMGPFDLAAEIHAIRETGVQKRNNGLPVCLNLTDAAVVHANCCSRCLGHGVSLPV
jgi:hypothetical protein